jgi:cell division protein FtsI/penicillin-binding protein 2
MISVFLLPTGAKAATKRKRHAVARKAVTRNAHHRTVAATALIARASLTTSRPSARPSTLAPITKAPVIRGGPWLSPTYADSTTEDFIDGEDLDVRRAAVAALGPYNGSIVVVDAGTGRILAMVNQKLALGSGFQPCSTIKVSVALTALHEKVITPTQKVNGIDLKYALAHSNNGFFAALGTRMGYETVSKYAHLFGYGEKAGLNIQGEQPGHYPEAPPKNGGMGMLTSFGEEISQTPLELAALMGALANGGKLYYLQYPRSQSEAQHFIPKVKRELDIKNLISEVKPGMLGAVEYGTARRIMNAVQDQPIAGKTGTCTDSHTHLGWFGSFNDSGSRKLVVVVLLTGGRPVIGPLAAGVAGDVYKNLGQVNYFARKSTAAPALPAALLAMPMCCK